MTFGKPLGKVPDNFLGAGVVGEGWTIVGERVANGKRVVQLGRRASQTGAIEQHEINADTYKAAKAYREEQTGMSKSKKAMALTEADLGRALDPQGDIRPDFFDSASGSWHIQPNPGSPQSIWIADSLVRDFKAGKPGALEKLREAAGLNNQAEASLGTQIASGAAAAILGKSLAKAVGLPSVKSAAPETPSSIEPIKKETKAEEVSPTDRAAEEEEERKKRLEGAEEDEEEEASEEEAPVARRTTAFTATNKPGESAQVRAENPEVSASVRLPTNAQTAPRVVGNTGTPLTIAPLAEPIPLSVTPTEAPLTPAREERTQRIEKQYAELEKNPAFQKAVYEERLRSPQTNGSNASPDAPLDDQAKERAVKAWLETHPEDVKGDLAAEIDPVRATLARAKARKDKQKKEEAVAATAALGVAAAASGASAASSVAGATAAASKTSGLRAPRAPRPSSAPAPTSPPGLRLSTTTSTFVPGSSAGTLSSSVTVQSSPAQPGIRGLRDQLRTERRPAPRSRGGSSPSPSTSSPSSSGGGLAAGAGIAATAGALGADVQKVLTSFASTAANTAKAIQGLSREQALAHVQRTLLEGESHAKYVATRAKELAEKNGTAGSAEVSVPLQEGNASPEESAQDLLSPPTSAAQQSGAGSTPSSASNDLAAAQVMAELLALNESLASLRSLEGAVLALPANGTVPPDAGVAPSSSLPATGLASGTSVGAPLGTPPSPSGGTREATPSTPTVAEAPTSTAASSSPAPTVTAPVTSSTPLTQEQAQPQPAQSFEAPAPQIPSGSRRVGPAPVPRRAPTAPSRGLFGGIKSQVLGGAFAAMTNLNAAQATDRGGSLQRDDAYETALGSDTSVSGDQNTSLYTSPLALGGRRSATSLSDGDVPDVFAAPSDEAKEMRTQADQQNATQQQFSGTGEGDASSEGEQASQGREEDSSQMSGADQAGNPAARAVQMQAAQQADKRQQAAEKEKTPPQATATTNTTHQPATGSSFTSWYTKGKLLFDLLEGCLDGSFGFFQFLFESDLALINDKYLHLKAIPYSLKTPGESERSERYTQYAVVLMNFLIAAVVFLNIAAFVVIIYIIVDIVSSPVTAVVSAVAT